MTQYRIVRHYADDTYEKEVILTGLSREEAQAHCNSPQTSSKTATTVEANWLTAVRGEWFDAFESEDS